MHTEHELVILADYIVTTLVKIEMLNEAGLTALNTFLADKYGEDGAYIISVNTEGEGFPYQINIASIDVEDKMQAIASKKVKVKRKEVRNG